MDSGLCETDVTGETISQLLEKSSKLHVSGHKIKDVHAAVIGVGQGFTSQVLRVNLEWSSTEPHLPKSVIVKVVRSSNLRKLFPDMAEEAMEKLKQSLLHAHNAECAIYNLKGLSDTVPMAMCYQMVVRSEDEPGIIILEDLGDRAVTLSMTAMWDGFTLGQVGDFLDALTSLHAWSVNNTDWRKDIISLKEFNIMEHLVNNFVQTFPQAKKLYPDLLKNLDEEKFSKYINSDGFVEIFGCDPKVRYNLPLVLVHGDVHIMNMMFEKKSNDESGDKVIALLDWQVSHQGCAMEDLVRLLLICLSTELRRNNTDRILHQYVQLFNSKVNNANDQIHYENLKHAYNEMFPYYAVMWMAGVIMLDTVTSQLPLAQESERKVFKDKFLNIFHSNYEDGMKILNW